MSVVCYCFIFAGTGLVPDFCFRNHSFIYILLKSFCVLLDSMNTMDKFDLEWYVNVLTLVCLESSTWVLYLNGGGMPNLKYGLGDPMCLRPKLTFSTKLFYFFLKKILCLLPVWDVKHEYSVVEVWHVCCIGVYFATAVRSHTLALSIFLHVKNGHNLNE